MALLFDGIGDLLPLCLWVLGVIYIIRSSPIETKDKISLSVSMTALIVSLYTAKKTLSPRPDIRLAGGTFPEDIHIGAEFPLVFYNSGRMPTYFRVREINPSDPRVEVIPNQFPLQQITDKGYWHANCRIRAREGRDPSSAHRVTVTVRFMFWSGRRPVLRKGKIALMVKGAE